MFRLLEGDVGSGKTVIAALSMYCCIKAGYQAVLMAPTEILAKQHETFLKNFFKNEIKGEGLYSSLSTKERKDILEKLRSNELDYAVGTHALFQDDVSFNNLGLVITDEQQRFGVNQRSLLAGKGKNADILMMSATPIPRTLANAIYGDMDISLIEHLPAGRQKIETYYIPKNSLISFKDKLEQLMTEGNQAFIVCPSIEEGIRNVRNVETLYTNLKKEWEGKFKVAYLHGKLSSEQKDKIMEEFRNHDYDVLISTTVVEVGVDIENANIMIVYDAQCFGLSQLHQLRGRIARHGKRGYCYLLSNDKNEDVKERLKFISENNDGFKLAEYDLNRRGPGDLLGKRQSGLPQFILGDIYLDREILNNARKDARIVLNNIDEYPQAKEYLDNGAKEYLYQLD